MAQLIYRAWPLFRAATVFHTGSSEGVEFAEVTLTFMAIHGRDQLIARRAGRILNDRYGAAPVALAE